MPGWHSVGTALGQGHRAQVSREAGPLIAPSRSAIPLLQPQDQRAEGHPPSGGPVRWHGQLRDGQRCRGGALGTLWCARGKHGGRRGGGQAAASWQCSCLRQPAGGWRLVVGSVSSCMSRQLPCKLAGRQLQPCQRGLAHNGSWPAHRSSFHQHQVHCLVPPACRLSGWRLGPDQRQAAQGAAPAALQLLPRRD